VAIRTRRERDNEAVLPVSKGSATVYTFAHRGPEWGYSLEVLVKLDNPYTRTYLTITRTWRGFTELPDLVEWTGHASNPWEAAKYAVAHWTGVLVKEEEPTLEKAADS